MEEQKNKPTEEQLTRRKINLSLVVVTLLITILYRVLVFGNLEQTALMFIGLPICLAVLLSYTKPAKSCTGSIMKGITFFLLLALILAIEGFICVLMAAPFFYAIGFIIGIFADRARVQREFNKLRVSSVAFILAVMSLEGVNETLSFNRNQEITVTKNVTMNRIEAEKKLNEIPQFNFSKLPLYLKMGFPKPVEIQGSGMKVGDEWKLHFAGGEGKPGDMISRVTEAKPGYYLVECISDKSHVAHWLAWQSAEWTLNEISSEETQVTLKIKYRRLLDPSWYFSPSEKYAVTLAGHFLIDTIYSNADSFKQ